MATTTKTLMTLLFSTPKSIGHFRVALCLSFKMSLMKMTSICMKMDSIFFLMFSRDRRQDFSLLGGGGVRWVRPHPLTRRKGPVNLRVRVKMTLRMQEKWTSRTSFFRNFPEKYTPGCETKPPPPPPPLGDHASSARTHPSKILATGLMDVQVKLIVI